MRPQQPAQDTVLTKRGDGLVDISPVDLLTHRKHFWVAECAGGLVDPGGGGCQWVFKKKFWTQVSPPSRTAEILNAHFPPPV